MGKRGSLGSVALHIATHSFREEASGRDLKLQARATLLIETVTCVRMGNAKHHLTSDHDTLMEAKHDI